MKAYGLFDVGEHNTATVQFTHFQLGSLAQLDRLYVTSDLFSSLTGFYVKPIFFSDHCLVSALFGVRQRRAFRPQWDLWKMNGDIIHGDEFSNGLIDIFGRVEQDQDLCIFAKWDLLKQEVRSFAIEQSV